VEQGQWRAYPFGEDGDRLAINPELAVLGLDCALVLAVGRIVLEEIDLT
jgi:hypothetical protein